MMTDPIAMGTEGGPVSSLNYKRAVLRLPPREFTVEVLSPTKQGNNFSYGLLICPVIRSKRSSDSRSTSSSDSEYEIWRRWEDCLDFQETLENEYSKMSRQKVKVLKRGAAKKQGDDRDYPYNLHQAAASFDSLPEGPDPREVVIDVHELIPPLTRKATLFRASRSTLKQRADEFAAMIHALFNSSEDAPVLLQELRNCSPVRDFFGFWRRDKELVKKSGKDVSRALHSNHSMSSLSTSFSLSTTPSSPASSAFPRTPISPVAGRHSMLMRLPQRGATECSQDVMSPGSHLPTSAPPASRRFEPNSPGASQLSVSSYRDSQAGTDLSPASMLFTDELLLQDDPNPDAQSVVRRRPLTHVSAPMSAPLLGSQTQHQVPRPSNFDASYPTSEDVLPRPQPRPRSNSNAAPEYRNARIFFSTPSSPAEPFGHLSSQQISPSHLTHGHAVSSLSSNVKKQMSHLLSPIPSQSSSKSASISSRPSNMSMNRFSMTSSVSSYTQAPSKCSSSSHDSQYSCDFESYTDLGFAPPHSPIMFHTSLSEVAEAPDSDLGHRPRDSTSSFASCRTEVSADGVLPPHLRIDNHAPLPVGRSMSESRNDLTDTSFDDHVDGPKLSTETPGRVPPRVVSHSAKHSASSSSSAGSVVSGETPVSPRDAFAVKAVYRESVVVFRAERNTSLANIRQRLQGRFALCESVPLDDDFVLAYLPSRTGIVKGEVAVRNGRSNSVTSSTADVSHLRLLQTEIDWQTAMTTCGGKVTLRVLDAATQV